MDILCKNPDTDNGLYCKPLKNGQVIGNAVGKNEYEVVFQDEKYSYCPEDSNSIDYQSYCSPLAVLHICNTLFGHILKSRKEYAGTAIKWLGVTQGKADNAACTVEIPSFYIDSSWYRNGRFLLSKYIDGIEIVQQSKCIFRLTVTGKSVFDAFNLLALVAVFAHVTNNYGMFIYIDDNLAQKLGRILTNIENVPYFVFYLFTLRAVKSVKQFEALKPIFEDYLAKNGLKANLVIEGTLRQRLTFITNLLELDMPVLDIGCGELTYYKKMMSLNFTANYHAVDKDPDMEQIASNISRRYDDDNLFFYNSLDEFTSGEQVNILLTEVIEHNSMEEAKELIARALSYNFNKLVITTPNVEFNPFYSMESELRHEDHCFELTRDEFKSLITSCIEGKNVNVEYFYLGDSLNGIQPVQGCIIKR
ncbi:MAG: class I SAM-dependent methyltransferase [Tannerella sp.]|nr:class I SAM-dependent methyltransferase [Tannerella sp.]